MIVDPKAILEEIRRENRPLIKIHTGKLEEIRDHSPGAAHANEFVEDWLEQPGNQAPEGETPAALENAFVTIAEWEHPLGWAHTEDDAEAWELERRIIYERAKAGDEEASRIFPHLMTTDAFNAFGWHGKWYHYGCQSIEVEDKYAASLCATKIAPSELEYVRLPWPCFVVRVPKFLQSMVINGERLRIVVVNHVNYKGAVTITGQPDIAGATTEMEQYRLSLITANKYRILPCTTLAQWAEPNPMKAYDEFRLIEVEHDERARRQLEIIGRLVLGAVIAMNDPKVHRRFGRSKLAKDRQPGSPRYGTNDQVVLHKLGRPVKIDARETITDYVQGSGRVTNVRTLVAGHWKNQPYGPKHSLRRWQHVECYWRGNEDAPMIIRPHTLSGGP